MTTSWSLKPAALADPSAVLTHEPWSPISETMSASAVVDPIQAGGPSKVESPSPLEGMTSDPSASESSASVDGSTVKNPHPDWIGEALGTTVTAMDIQPMGPSRGFQSTTWKLHLSCDPAGSAPASVVLKSETSNKDFNELSRLHNAFGREVGVYTHCVPRLKNHQPTIYACHGGEISWLLMEDLTHLRAGDQVIGLSHADVRDSVRRMAALHAEFWLDPHLELQSWLPLHSFWFQKPKPELVEDFFTTYAIRFGARVCQLFRAVLEQGEAIDAALHERPWTLVHGDLRADNLLFDGTADDPTAIILDWSWACRSLGAIDLAFLLGGSAPLAQRQGRLEDLLQSWHDELLRRGVRDYPLAEARRDLQLASLRCITAGVAMYGFLQDPDTTIRTALFMDQAIQRHAALAEELEAWEALPDPSGFAQDLKHQR
jgi:hypothetical protein